MRLNLGCGNRKLQGWRNVDKVPDCSPDELVDLEQLPWPWPDNSVDEIFLSHVLEHLGQATDVYLGIIKELYRVCRDGATITIIVPHPRHDHFLTDPTHVRAVTAEVSTCSHRPPIEG
jgi:predicted SAM-dependent methyltransferase